jgi:hypothetical protein
MTNCQINQRNLTSKELRQAKPIKIKMSLKDAAVRCSDEIDRESHMQLDSLLEPLTAGLKTEPVAPLSVGRFDSCGACLAVRQR